MEYPSFLCFITPIRFRRHVRHCTCARHKPVHGFSARRYVGFSERYTRTSCFEFSQVAAVTLLLVLLLYTKPLLYGLNLRPYKSGYWIVTAATFENSRHDVRVERRGFRETYVVTDVTSKTLTHLTQLGPIPVHRRYCRIREERNEIFAQNNV